jgi:hypothetical protein
MDETANPNGKMNPRHETAEVRTRYLLMFGMGVVALVVIGMLVSAAAFRFFVTHQSLGPPASPFENVRTLPPQPRLQIDAPEVLKRYREAQDQILDSYGWIDRQAGTVRIPIDRAIDLLLAQGLPARSSAEEGSGSGGTKEIAGQTAGKIPGKQVTHNTDAVGIRK